MVVWALEANVLTIAFNSGRGNADVEVKIELDVMRSESQKTGLLALLMKLMGSWLPGLVARNGHFVPNFPRWRPDGDTGKRHRPKRKTAARRQTL